MDYHFDSCQAICCLMMRGEITDDIEEPMKDAMELIKEIYYHMEYFDDQHTSKDPSEKQVQKLAMSIYKACENNYRKYHPKEVAR